MSLYKYIAAAPKAELHVHLEGSIQPSTLLMLAKRNHVDLPTNTEKGLRDWYRFRDFHHFIEVYVKITQCLQTTEDFELIVYEFGAEMAKQNIRYAEVTFSPSTHFAINGVDQNIWFKGLTEGRRRVKECFGAEINWVFDLVRNDNPIDGRFEYTTRMAIEGKDHGVVALGLGGIEAGYPPAPFTPWFDRARAAGLHSVPHAGEFGGPASIWSAIADLGAERIGHGVRAIEDPDLVSYLAEHHIPLEVSSTSNISLGIYPDLKSHPLKRLHDSGVAIIVNSDDPPLFNTTLTKEFGLLVAPYGFSNETIDEILLNGIRFSFLPETIKRRMRTSFIEEMSKLRKTYGIEPANQTK